MLRILLLTITSAVLFPTTAFAQIKWEKSFATAKQLATRSKKPLLIDFYAPWCGPCHKMEEETFTNPTVRALMARMVCVRLNVDKNPPQAHQYGVSSIPRLIVLPPNSTKPILDLQGFYGAKEIQPELRQALGLKANAAIPIPLFEESPALAKVRQALQSQRYAALKASNPQLAADGLNQLVGRLGTKKEDDPAVLLQKAGNDAIPALLRGMGHKYLAVRVGSYRVLQNRLRQKNITEPVAFDPWAASKVRQAQINQWSQWWKTKIQGVP